MRISATSSHAHHSEAPVVDDARTWEFRVKGNLGTNTRIDSDCHALVLRESSGIRVMLCAEDEGIMIKDTAVLLLTGTGYASAGDAERDGEAWLDYVMVGCASQHIGMDFGFRAPYRGGLTPDALQSVADDAEAQGHGPVQVHNHRSGVQVYRSHPPAVFFQGSARAYALRKRADVLAAVAAAADHDARMTDRQRLAYDLYAASFNPTPTDACFMLLAMAVETLIDQRPRSPEAQHRVAQLIEVVLQAELDPAEISSIVGTLKGWGERESVSRAGRRLAAGLAGRTYDGRTPEKFFSYIYALRSDLAHGNLPRPGQDETAHALGHLHLFVGDLLALQAADELSSSPG